MSPKTKNHIQIFVCVFGGGGCFCSCHVHIHGCFPKDIQVSCSIKISGMQILALSYILHTLPCPRVLFILNWLEWKSNWRQLLVETLMFHSACPCLTEDRFSLSGWLRVGGVRALWQNCKAAEWTDVSQWLMFLPALPQRSCVPMHL